MQAVLAVIGLVRGFLVSSCLRKIPWSSNLSYNSSKVMDESLALMTAEISLYSGLNPLRVDNMNSTLLTGAQTVENSSYKEHI